MKAKVLTRFRDKYSGKIHEVGSTITISRERYDEILTVGNLVEEIKTTTKAKTTTKQKEAV